MSSPKTITVPTTTLYDAWASTYDTDSNILQALDTAAFTARVPALLSSLPPAPRLLDLGCGTGRNTQRLLPHVQAGGKLYAVDASEGMLSLAQTRLASTTGADTGADRITWKHAEMSELRGVLGEDWGRIDSVVSTLVLEHVPLATFFAAVGGALKAGGWAWVTDMHVAMGSSRAGYKDGDVKFWGQSWNHGFEETVRAAGETGLVLEGAAEERGVGDEEEAERLGPRARKWVGRKMLVGLVLRKCVT